MDWNYNDINRELAKLRTQQENKLNKGRDKLFKAGEDPDLLGSALVSYHGALEDHIRASLVAVVPEGIRRQILDKKITSWKHLIDYGRQYLDLSQKDADFISEANSHRNDVAHGDAFNWEKRKLISYTEFVEKWCSTEKKYLITESVDKTESSKSYYPSKHVPDIKTDYEPYSSPWYRSSCFLWLTFLFFNPLWALLILTDKYQSGLLKFVVGFFYSGVIILWLWALSNPYVSDTYNDVSDKYNDISNPTVETVDTNFLQIEPEVTKTIKPYKCSIIWEKYSDSSDLFNKNRSMVWDEIVSYLVEGSEMTPREFFDQVVERNPSLAIDGYVFKEGSVYFLPRCE